MKLGISVSDMYGRILIDRDSDGLLFLGLDPASHQFGWGLIGAQGQPVDMGVWGLEGKSLLARMDSLVGHWEAWEKVYGQFVWGAAIEGQYVGENALSAIEICYSAGTAMGLISGLDFFRNGEMPYRTAQYEPSAWRKSFGFAWARREEAKMRSIHNVTALIGDQHHSYGGTPLESIPFALQDNATDALLIAVHGRNELYRNALKMSRVKQKTAQAKRKYKN